jgi:hypothetical protein
LTFTSTLILWTGFSSPSGLTSRSCVPMSAAVGCLSTTLDDLWDNRGPQDAPRSAVPPGARRTSWNQAWQRNPPASLSSRSKTWKSENAQMRLFASETLVMDDSARNCFMILGKTWSSAGL